jgi:hypothetical protein
VHDSAELYSTMNNLDILLLIGIKGTKTEDMFKMYTLDNNRPKTKVLQIYV